MKIYSELIKSVEENSSLKEAAANLESKLIHLIETIKQEIGLLKQQEILLQRACNHYNDLAQNFPDRSGFLNNITNRDMCELRTQSYPHPSIWFVAESISIFLNINEKWVNFYGKLNPFRPSTFMDVDYNDISDQTLQDLGVIVNAHRNNISILPRYSLAATGLFSWLIATYDWAIKIRDHFPQFSSFKEIHKLVDKEILEYNYLETVNNMIKKKEIELNLLENIELPIIKKILEL